MKAFIIYNACSDQSSWFHKVATNYSQLNIDYCVADRFEDTKLEYDFFITTDQYVPWHKFSNYEYVVAVPAGTILPFTFFENRIESLIFNYETLHYCDVTIYNPVGNGSHTIDVTHWYTLPKVDYTNEHTFSKTHDEALDILIRNSNHVYVLHHEIPNPRTTVSGPIQQAWTVSSGFFVNYLLEDAGFSTDTKINHIDISRPGLDVRKYIIENWDGKNFPLFLDHLHEKFQLLDMLNHGKFKKDDTRTIAVLEHMENKWGSEQDWIDHWKKYQQCSHSFYHCNLMDITNLRKNFEKHQPAENTVFWYNGALKRQPGNTNKTSDGSHQQVKEILNVMHEFNPNMRLYGSDHCCTEFNGHTPEQCLELILNNSRDMLWKQV